jgi:fibronectin-binding autotransporter adhesin
VSAAKKLLAVTAGSLALLILPSGALADTTITVDTGGDGAGGCTLRNAIDSADTNASVGTCPAGTGNDTVVIPASIASPINLNSELLAGGTGTLTINGPGVAAMTVSGQNAVRVLHAVGPVAVTNLTLANGAVLAANGATGGGVNVDASGSLTLDHVKVSGNAVGAVGTTGGTAAFGGGIFADGPLALTDSTVEQNTAVAVTTGTAGGDSALSEGAGVMASGTSGVNILRSTIDTNGASASAPTGSDGSFAVGGGLAVGNTGANTASIVASTISENAIQALDHPGSPTDGGGIFSVAGGGTVLVSDTLTENTAGIGANLGGANTTLGNVLLSLPGGGGTNCNAAKTSAGFNIEDGNSCGLTQPTDKVSVLFTGLDPNLASNGGPTQTHALQNSGPAIDAGNSFGLTTDQRGMTRPVDFSAFPNAADGTDVGAYEIQKACPGQITPGGPCTANMQTTPSALGFGDVLVGTVTGAQTITVSNTGTADLHLGSVTLGGTDPGEFAKSADSCSSATLVPTASCSIGVQFGPTSTGDKRATVSVTGDAPGNPTDTVNLTGRGVVPSSSSPPPPVGPTGKRDAALRKCKKKFRKGTQKRKKCVRNAKQLPE